MTDVHRLWADAHQVFAVPRTGETVGPLADVETAWNSRLIDEAPNGRLLTANAVFSALRSDAKLHLLHVTHAFDRIVQTGELLPSGGCLVGSVYCAPLFSEASGLRPHNLASYILTREVPANLARSSAPGREPTALVIEITMPPRAHRELAGLDYLRLGAIHLRDYKHLEYLLSREEQYRLREVVVERVRGAMGFLSLAAAVAYRGHSGGEEFPHLLHDALRRIPVLGYIYFEALSEYLMLYSRSPHTCRLAERGEFNNWLYKELIFGNLPGVPGGFDLSRFGPRLDDLSVLLNRLDPTIDPVHARHFLVERISYLTAANLFTRGDAPGSWHRIRWDFPSVVEQFGPLAGHLIHRGLRAFRRYPDFYFFFDQYKALQAWNYWNHMDIVVPFNGTMPKGEVGINPAYPGLRYTIWRAEADERGSLHPVEELPLRIAPRLVDTKHTLMRTQRLSHASTDCA
ncbi:hypothetical protein [Streptomyces sp. NPDC096068]|uniref:hypothetical protein n=1 Tax=Streptomyces sp. NPDC096068 TaxID=3155424 RepID=UPI003325DE4E